MHTPVHAKMYVVISFCNLNMLFCKHKPAVTTDHAQNGTICHHIQLRHMLLMHVHMATKRDRSAKLHPTQWKPQVEDPKQVTSYAMYAGWKEVKVYGMPGATTIRHTFYKAGVLCKALH